jgi:SAM-dependent methyltransferase
MEILVKKYVQPEMKVLDLGCGNGRLVEILPEVRYIGIDGCEALVGEAKKIYDLTRLPARQGFKNYEFKVLDMLELEKLREKDLDVVFMFASLNHIVGEENRRKVLEDIKKILKPGGMMVVTNWSMWQVGAGKSIWRYKLIKTLKHESIKTNHELGLGLRDVMTLWQSGDKKRRGELYYRAFGLGELRGLFRRTGFEVIENYYSSDGQRVHWWNGKNIVTVGRTRE